MTVPLDALLRHIDACNTARLPGHRLRFRLGGADAGWLEPDFAAALTRAAGLRAEGGPEGGPGGGPGGGVITLANAGVLPALARQMAEAGHYRWRGEAFDVRATEDGPVLATIDRGALPSFGLLAWGAHVNGIVESPDGPLLWVARRAANKLLDPGKLDHIVAGGVPAGSDPDATVEKEAGEEASIPPALARTARKVAVIRYAMERPEGLRRDVLHCYDLTLPPDFVPRPADDEVEAFELWPLGRALDAVAAGDAFKFNVNLVLIDLFLRRGLIGGTEAQTLRTALERRPEG